MGYCNVCGRLWQGSTMTCVECNTRMVLNRQPCAECERLMAENAQLRADLAALHEKHNLAVVRLERCAADLEATELEAEHQMHEAQRWAGRAEVAELQKAASTERADQLVSVWKERALIAEADMEQAFREGYSDGGHDKAYNPLGALAAWRERRAAERGTR